MVPYTKSRNKPKSSSQEPYRVKVLKGPFLKGSPKEPLKDPPEELLRNPESHLKASPQRQKASRKQKDDSGCLGFGV